MDDRPPLGLSEDEAFSAPTWVGLMIVLASLFLFLMALALIANGIIIAFDLLELGADWAFWGDTYLLGALLVVSGLLMLLGLVGLDRGNLNGLGGLFAGVVLFELVMLRAVLVTTSDTSRLVYFLVMLLAFLLLLPFQMRDVRMSIATREAAASAE